MAAFTDIIVVKKRPRRHLAAKANQRGRADGLNPKRLVQSSFTLVDPSSQLEYRI